MLVHSTLRNVCLFCGIALILNFGFENISTAIMQERELLVPVFPQYPPSAMRGAAITIKDGVTLVEEKELPPDMRLQLADATPNQVQRGEELLRQTAKFLCSKDSVTFKALKHNDEEGTMGFVRSDRQVELRFARPNQLSYRWTHLGDPNFFVEVIADGEFVIRREYGRCFVLPAPQTPSGLIESAALKPADVWRFDAPRILSLFDPEAVESLIESCTVSYRGTRKFGPVTANRIILDGGGPTPSDWSSFRWELYVAQGNQPVPIYLRPDLDGLFPSLKGKDRWSASDIRFTKWSFDDATQDSFRIRLKNEDELVDSRQALGLGEPQDLNPMVGRLLPEFTALDELGQNITRNDLVSEGPLVLVLWGSENAAIGAWWKKFDSVRKKYKDSGIQFKTLHIGEDRQLQSGLARWNASPPVLKLTSDPVVFAEGSTAFDWGLKRKQVPPGNTIQAYIVDKEGVIQQIIERGPQLVEQLTTQLDGMLRGLDMARENARVLEQQKSARKALIERVNNRLPRSPAKKEKAAIEDATKLIGSIADKLNSDPRLKGPKRTLEDVGLFEQFETGMTATVFVPKALLNDSARDTEQNPRRMRELMEYHVVYGELTDAWFEKQVPVLTQLKIGNGQLHIVVSKDQKGTNQANGIPVLETIEATNGRICLIDGQLDPTQVTKTEIQ